MDKEIGARWNWHLNCFTIFHSPVTGSRPVLESERPFIDTTVGSADARGPWSLRSVYVLAGAMAPWFAVFALLFCGLGLYVGISVAHVDPRQAETSRIMLLHVPAVWSSMLVFLLLAACAIGALAYDARLPGMMARALAPTAAMFALLALWTGSLWSRATLGVWWVWDMRPVSLLILLLLCAGFIWAHAAITDRSWADKAGAVLAIMGIVDIPVSVESVQWWPDLFRAASISMIAAPGTELPTQAGILAMVAGFCAYACTVATMRLRCLILEQERFSDWVTMREQASP